MYFVIAIDLILLIVLLPLMQGQHWNIHLFIDILHLVIYCLRRIEVVLSLLVLMRLKAETSQTGLVLFLHYSIPAKGLHISCIVVTFDVVVFDEIVLPLTQLCFFFAQFFYLFGQILLCKKQVVLSLVAELDHIFIPCYRLEQSFVFKLVLLLYGFQLFLLGSEDLLITDVFFQFLAFSSEGLVLSVHAVDYLLVCLVIKRQLWYALQGLLQSPLNLQLNAYYLLFQIKHPLLQILILFHQFGLLLCHGDCLFLYRGEFYFKQRTIRARSNCSCLLSLFFNCLLFNIADHPIQLRNQLVPQFHCLLQFTQFIVTVDLPQTLFLLHFLAQNQQLYRPSLTLLFEILFLLPYYFNQRQVSTFELMQVTNQSEEQYFAQSFFEHSTFRSEFDLCLITILYNNDICLSIIFC